MWCQHFFLCLWFITPLPLFDFMLDRFVVNAIIEVLIHFFIVFQLFLLLMPLLLLLFGLPSPLFLLLHEELFLLVSWQLFRFAIWAYDGLKILFGFCFNLYFVWDFRLPLFRFFGAIIIEAIFSRFAYDSSDMAEDIIFLYISLSLTRWVSSIKLLRLLKFARLGENSSMQTSWLIFAFRVL